MNESVRSEFARRETEANESIKQVGYSNYCAVVFLMFSLGCMRYELTQRYPINEAADYATVVKEVGEFQAEIRRGMRSGRKVRQTALN